MDSMLEQRLCTLERENRWWRRMVAVAVLALLVLAQPGTRAVVAQSTQATLAQRVATLEKKLKRQGLRLAELENKLAHWRRSGNDLYITGANLHLRNGHGATNGYAADPQSIDPAVTRTNGLGNLIVGYNELRGNGLDVRTGSHTLVLGAYQNYGSYGGLVAGQNNTLAGPYASASGGKYNTVSGPYASASGGVLNTASGSYAAASGGYGSTASGAIAAVNGGYGNTASGSYASVAGGASNAASGPYGSVSGGYRNVASANLAAVSGGASNTASGIGSTVSGGANRTAPGTNDWVAGGFSQDF